MSLFLLHCAVGLIVSCIIAYFLGWLCYCLKSQKQLPDTNLELGRTRSNITKNTNGRPNEAYFLSNEGGFCCDFKNPVSSHECNQNPYCAGKLLLKLKSSILSAKSSICVAMFNFNNGEVCNYILEAKRNPRIQIRILVDKSSCADGKNKQAKRLMEAGIEVRLSGDDSSSVKHTTSSGDENALTFNSLMHNKFCVIDGGDECGVVITGSLNWTYTALSKHAENVVFLYDESIQREFLQFFDHLWNSSIELKELLDTPDSSLC